MSLAHLEEAARGAIDPEVWQLISHGEIARERCAYEVLTLRPRYLRDVSGTELGTTLLGSEVSLPVFLSPTSFQERVHPDGAAEAARGAAAAGALTIVAGRPDGAFERAAAAGGARWLQLYCVDREQTRALVERAGELGYTALVPTVDVPVVPSWERERIARAAPGTFSAAVPDSLAFTWDDLEWLRGVSPLPVVLKGIVSPEDASLAVERGVEGLLVSRHAGRSLQATRSAVEVLPEVVDAAGGKAEVYVDTGVRSGADVLRALALGARAAGVGRPLLWGLALGGADGVRGLLDVLAEEIGVALAVCGLASVSEIDGGVLDPRGA